MEIIYIRILFVYIFFYTAFSYLQIKHRAYRKYKFFVIFSLGSALFRTIASILLVCVMENKLLGRVLGSFVSLSILNVCLWGSIVYKGRKISRDCISYALFFSVPLIPHALSGFVLGNSDRIMIKHFCGTDETAMYSLAYTISAISEIIWTAMRYAWQPWLFDHLKEENTNDINHYSKIYFGCFAVILVGLLLISPEVIYIMGGEQYYEARFVMPPVILGFGYQFIYGIYSDIEFYEAKTKYISLGSILAAVVNLILNALFIPRFGYLAAAYTTLVGFMGLSLFHYIIVWRLYPYRARLFSKKYLVAILVGMTCIAAISIELYNHTILRVISIILYFLILIFGFYKLKDTFLSVLTIKKKYN